MACRESDEELMGQVARGDMRALGELFERHKQPLFNYLYRFLHHQALAEDVLVDAFLRVQQRGKTFKAGARFTTWLYAIAHHLATDRLRQPSRRELPWEDELCPPSAPDAVQRETEQTELARVVREAVAALPADQRAAVIFRVYHDLSYREIASITGTSEEGARVRAHRGRQALKKLLAPYITQEAELPVTFGVLET